MMIVNKLTWMLRNILLPNIVSKKMIKGNHASDKDKMERYNMSVLIKKFILRI